LLMDLTTEGYCLKGSHSPTIEGDRLGGERDSQASDEQGCFQSTFKLYRDLENEEGRDEDQIEDDERGDEDKEVEETEDVEIEALCQSCSIFRVFSEQ
jgi:hypothetical protein